jgi:uncharacterized protein
MALQQAADLREILRSARVIAVVGHSDNPERTSYQIAAMLRRENYVVYPVNPTLGHIDGQVVYPDLASVPEPIDIVNVFRRSEFLAGVVEQALEVGARVVWAQLGVSDPLAAARAEGAGLTLIMNRCIKVEYYRLLGAQR